LLASPAPGHGPPSTEQFARWRVQLARWRSQLTRWSLNRPVGSLNGPLEVSTGRWKSQPARWKSQPAVGSLNGPLEVSRRWKSHGRWKSQPAVGSLNRPLEVSTGPLEVTGVGGSLCRENRSTICLWGKASARSVLRHVSTRRRSRRLDPRAVEAASGPVAAVVGGEARDVVVAAGGGRHDEPEVLVVVAASRQLELYVAATSSSRCLTPWGLSRLGQAHLARMEAGFPALSVTPASRPGRRSARRRYRCAGEAGRELDVAPTNGDPPRRQRPGVGGVVGRVSAASQLDQVAPWSR